MHYLTKITILIKKTVSFASWWNQNMVLLSNGKNKWFFFLSGYLKISTAKLLCWSYLQLSLFAVVTFALIHWLYHLNVFDIVFFSCSLCLDDRAWNETVYPQTDLHIYIATFIFWHHYNQGQHYLSNCIFYVIFIVCCVLSYAIEQSTTCY